MYPALFRGWPFRDPAAGRVGDGSALAGVQLTELSLLRACPFCQQILPTWRPIHPNPHQISETSGRRNGEFWAISVISARRIALLLSSPSPRRLSSALQLSCRCSSPARDAIYVGQHPCIPTPDSDCQLFPHFTLWLLRLFHHGKWSEMGMVTAWGESRRWWHGRAQLNSDYFQFWIPRALTDAERERLLQLRAWADREALSTTELKELLVGSLFCLPRDPLHAAVRWLVAVIDRSVRCKCKAVHFMCYILV